MQAASELSESGVGDSAELYRRNSLGNCGHTVTASIAANISHEHIVSTEQASRKQQVIPKSTAEQHKTASNAGTASEELTGKQQKRLETGCHALGNSQTAAHLMLNSYSNAARQSDARGRGEGKFALNRSSLLILSSSRDDEDDDERVYSMLTQPDPDANPTTVVDLKTLVEFKETVDSAQDFRANALDCTKEKRTMN